MVRVFIPWKPANSTNLGFISPEVMSTMGVYLPGTTIGIFVTSLLAQGYPIYCRRFKFLATITTRGMTKQYVAVQ